MTAGNAPKVLFVAGQLGRGGAEQQLFYMASALKDAGAEPEVVSMTRGEHWEQQLLERDIPVLWTGPSTSHARRLLTVVEIARRRRPAVIQSAHFQTNLYAALGARASGSVGIGAVRSSTRSSVADLGRLGTASLRTPRLIAANSHRAIDEAVELGVARARLQLLPNVVDLTRFPSAAARGPSAEVELLAVGRLVHAKRLDRFIRIVGELARSPMTGNKSVRGTIVGSGPLEANLRELAENTGVSDRIRWLGEVDAATIYAEADALVLTSDYEGTPNVVLEAMASGLPVVSFGVGEVPWLIEHGKTGLLAAEGDEAQLVAQLERLIMDEELRHKIGLAARSYVEHHHAVTLLPGLLDRLYRHAGG